MSETQLATEQATLVEVLRDKALRLPDREAYRFLLDGEMRSVRRTYRELDREARALAASLAERTRRGDRAVLLYPPGLEFIAAFLGCLYQGVIAVPAYPPTSRRTLPRLEAILKDARPALVLTSAEVFAEARRLFAFGTELARLDWLVTGAPEEPAALAARAEAWRDPGVGAETVAFLQYTSGSTSAPKGVEVRHGNLIHNQRLIRDGFRQTSESVVVGWLPLYHDMGLIGNVMQPLYVGARCVLMSPLAFLKRPARWLEAISTYRATTSGGPNFAYELAARKVTPEERRGLDLGSWAVAFNGAEPVRAATLERFSAAFAECGFRREAFYPCYGLAEATLFVTGGDPRQAPKIVAVDAAALERHRVVARRDAATPGEAAVRRLVGCGRAGAGERLLIVDPETREPLAAGRVGEIWVCGPSVAGGYWGQPEESERVFAARTAAGEGPFLRTGDLGFLQADGELVVTGRLKDLIILRGRNHYPQDVERTSEASHPAARPGGSAAFAIEVGDEERLAIVQEVERRFRGEAGEVAAAIRQAVAERHQIHVHAVTLIRAGSLPKTSSGKVRRRATRELFLAGELEEVGSSVAPTASETLAAGPDFNREELRTLAAEPRRAALLDFLRHLAARVTRQAPEAIDEAAPLTALGLDSLTAVELKNQGEAELGVAIPLADLLEGASLDELAARLAPLLAEKPQAGDALPELAPAAGDASGLLSHGQRALWFLQRLAPESAAYNLAATLRVKAALDVPRLQGVLDLLARRHAVLRAAFRATADGPRQEVLAERRVAFAVEDAAAAPAGELEERLARAVAAPFDLERDALMRVHVFRRGERESVVVLVVHHIVCDLASLGVLLGELRTLYELAPDRGAEALAPQTLGYGDYVRWQQRLLESAAGERLWQYWRTRLEGELPLLALPTDRPRPAHQSFRGAACRRLLAAEPTAGVKALAEGRGATLYAVVLAAFQALLGRYSGQREVLVGTPALGRTQAELDRLVGYFVNPVVMRGRLRPRQTFSELLDATRETVVEALVHQDFPFPLLVERLQPQRDPSRSPIFQAMFSLQRSEALSAADLAAFALGRGGVELDFAGLPAESLPLAQSVAQFDLELVAAELDGRLGFSLLYDTALFDATTAARLLENLRLLLAAAAAAPHREVLSLPLASSAERQALYREWNDRETADDSGRLFHRLFEAQARRQPDRLAVSCDGAAFTYAELNRRANRLARALPANGARAEERVAVLAERGLGLAAAMMAAFKSGTVYVPLDPRYPAERIRSILEQCRGGTLLSDARLLPLAERAAAGLAAAPRILDLDALAGGGGEEDLPLEVSPAGLAYVIFTSGSTGVPKGAMVAHRGLLNHLEAKIEDLALTASDKVAQTASQCFDISVWQFLAALVEGGTVQVFPDAVAYDPARLPAAVEAGAVTVFETVPSMLRAMLAPPAPGLPGAQPVFTSLRWLIPTGEALSPELGRQWLERYAAVPLVNAYGPTECSDDVTHAFLYRPPSAEALRVPIGRPIRNTRLHVLDAAFAPVPPGAGGELCVGGRGVGRGYLHDPRRTAEAFRPDPFAAEGGARLYKTGDLGRYLPDGQLEFFGRVDHQVKVRGFRVEPGEIETVLGAHPAVREAAVVARPDRLGNARLIAYWVAHRSVAEISREGSELRRWLAGILPEYMVPSLFVALRSLPLTANGKVDRKALPEPEGETGDGAAGTPLSSTEELVARIWSELLGLPRVEPEASFFDLGGHSLLATQVASRIRDLLGVELELRELFENLTLRSLAALVESRRREEAAVALPPLVPVAREGHPALSFAQERLWFLDQLQPGLVAYNMPAALVLEGEGTTSGIERALAAIVRRHETLRTTFREAGGKPVQVIAPAAAADALPRLDLSALPPSAAAAEARRLAAEDADRSFDLARGPLLRAALVELGGRRSLLVINLHHIIADGWSLQVLVKEISALSWSFAAGEAPPLAELPVQYADFSAWQRSWLDGELKERLLAYWRERLRGAPPSLDLPADRPRPPAQTFSGAAVALDLEAGLFAPIDAQARRHTVTLFMWLLAAFQSVLHRYTGSRDVPVGSPIANRTRTEVEGLIGFFVNTLVLRAGFGGDPSFAELLGQVRETTLGAYAHQDLPFEKLVEELQPQRDLSHSPLFQVIFALQDPPFAGLELPGLTLTPLEPYRDEPAKFDLELYVWRQGDGLGGQLVYNTDLYDPTTARRLVRHFAAFARSAAGAPERPVSRLPLLGDQEAHQLVDELNEPPDGAPRTPTLVELFASRAASDSAAVVSEGAALTYAELDRRGNRLAHRLRTLGVGPETPVGLCVERSPDMVVAILGILKAGGAYVPLDPSYPPERLAYVLGDALATSAAPLLVTEEQLTKLFREDGDGAPRHRVLRLDADRRSLARESPRPPAVEIRGDNLAYVIYTSGSTGRPKGVPVTHANVARLLAMTERWFGFGENDVWTLFHSYAFDFSVWEIWGALAYGGTLVIVPQATTRAPESFRELLADERVTVLNQTPSAFRQLVEADGGAERRGLSLRRVIFGGEALELAALRPWVERHGDGSPELINMYGITETTVHVTYRAVKSADLERAGASPVGRPIPDLGIHLLGRRLELAPLGVPGEICVGGAGLARGYLGRAALAAQRFVADPFAGRPGGRLYRSGDLARRRAGGELEYLGRIDNQVKIRGFRIELGEIEAALDAHPGVREAVVMARPGAAGPAAGALRLVAWIVPREERLTAGELRDHLRRRLPEHMVPAAFVALEKMPLTAHGKVDRAALAASPESELAPAERPADPRTPQEELLAGIWASVLGRERVGIHDSFFDLGGHSLLATQVISRVRALFRADVPLARLFEAPTVAAMAAQLGEERPSAREVPPIAPVPRTGEMPLSFAQERLWILDQMQTGTSVYAVPAMLRIRGPLRPDVLGSALAEVTRRHEVLRTSFPTVKGRPCQSIAPAAPGAARPGAALPHVDLSALPPPAAFAAARALAAAEAARPFDLARGPLMRSFVAALGGEEHLLVVVLHHIVSDDWSAGLLVKEVGALYRSFAAGLPSPLAELPVQYADFAAWQRSWLTAEVMEEKLAYWRGHLAGELPVLALPTDRPRPAAQTFRGAGRPVELPPRLAAAVKELSRTEGSTLFMTLLTAFAALLHRCSGQDDVVIGCPEANRDRLETEELIGMFVNVLPLRIDLSGEPSYRTLLGRVRAAALAGYEHADAPFEKIVEAVEKRRDMGHAAVRQVALAFENHALTTLELDRGVTCEPIRIETGTSRLDLTLFLWDAGETVAGVCEYNTDLFDDGTIGRFLSFFELLLADMAEDPERPVRGLPPLVPAPAEPRETAADPRQSNLTESQLLFWFAHRLNPEVELYFERATATFRVAGRLDHGHLERAFGKLVENADALRTTVVEVQGVPQRRVLPEVPAAVDLVDLSREADPESAFRAWLEQRTARRLDFGSRLFDTALVYLSDEESVWYWSVYHIVADAWSLSRTARVLSEHYRLSQEGTLDAAPPLPSYELFAAHERENRRSQRYERARQYWRAKLARQLDPPLFYLRPAVARTTHTHRLSVELGAEKTRRIEELVKSLGLFSPAVALATVLFAWMYRVDGRRTLRLGTPFANRRDPFAEIIGLEMNACPLQVTIAGDESFRSLAEKVQRDFVETGRFQFFPVPNPADQPVWSVYFNYQNVSYSELCGLPVEFTLLDTGHSPDAVDLQVRDFMGRGSLTLDFDFNREAFDKDQRRRSVDHYLRLLDAMLESAGQSLHGAEMLSPAEKRLLLETFNDTAVAYPPGLRLERLFAEQAARTPNATAVVDEAGSLTYRQLDERANRLAHRLRRLGVGPEVFVGIATERSVETLVGLFGILKAGGAYVPLDPAYPSERLAFMMDDARVPVLLTQERLLDSLRTGATTICLDRDRPEIETEPAHDPGDAGAAAGVAYMIYTSGSTGRPKGVMIPHSGIVNRLFWMQDAYRLTADDRVLQKTPMSFDVSVWELFWPLLCGARLVMARPGGHQDPAYLAEAISEHGITTLHFVPSMLQVFLAQRDLRSSCGSLRRVIVSGEALPEALRLRFFEALGASGGPELHNLYGPTEASVDVTSWACPAASSLGFVPIGRPIANTGIFLLDRRGRLAAPGIAAELHIGGVNLARGYLARPALTAEKFVPQAAPSPPGERLYRTGDLARHLPNGDVEFLGRIDHQVKVRGFRIELGEIEAAVARHAGVREVVVTDWRDASSNTRLVAYLVAAGETPPAAAELRELLSARLPDYMVPAAWVVLDEMPLTPSGKVDRKALPPPDLEAQAAAVEFVAPTTPLERFLASVFAEVLELDSVSTRASFFDLGGNSLMATQVVVLVQDVLPLKLELRNIFEAPTVASIAAQIEEARPTLSPEEVELMDEILADFIRMTEGEEEEEEGVAAY